MMRISDISMSSAGSLRAVYSATCAAIGSSSGLLWRCCLRRNSRFRSAQSSASGRWSLGRMVPYVAAIVCPLFDLDRLVFPPDSCVSQMLGMPRGGEPTRVGFAAKIDFSNKARTPKESALKRRQISVSNSDLHEPIRKSARSRIDYTAETCAP
jgi:hypothetical protein